MSDKKFTKGFFFSRKEDAPSFVIGTLSINEEEAIEFIKANSKDGKLKIAMLKSKAGNPYMVLDEYQAKPSSQPVANEDDDEFSPF